MQLGRQWTSMQGSSGCENSHDQALVAWSLPPGSRTYSWAIPFRASLTSNWLTGTLAWAFIWFTSSIMVRGDLAAANANMFYWQHFSGHALFCGPFLQLWHFWTSQALPISFSGWLLMLCSEHHNVDLMFKQTYIWAAPALHLTAGLLLACHKSWHQCLCSPYLLSLLWDLWLTAAWQPACSQRFWHHLHCVLVMLQVSCTWYADGMTSS